jgi:hypothetical protein
VASPESQLLESSGLNSRAVRYIQDINSVWTRFDTVVEDEWPYHHRMDRCITLATFADAPKPAGHSGQRINRLKKRLGDGRRILWRMLTDELSDAFEISQGFFGENDAVRVGHRELFAEEFGPRLLANIFPIMNFAAVNLVFGSVDRIECLFVESVLFQFAQRFERGMENSVG